MFCFPLRSQMEEEENDRLAEALFFHVYYAFMTLVSELVGVTHQKVLKISLGT